MGKSVACLFPGIGYTCDKPLLYYSGKLLKGLGWEIVPVPYTGFPSGVKGNPEKMQQSAHMALEQAEEILQEIDWNSYAEILLIGKSVGTVVCAAYARRHRLRFTEPRIHGRTRRQSRRTAVGWAFRFMKRRTPITRWKPVMLILISKTCGKQ